VKCGNKGTATTEWNTVKRLSVISERTGGGHGKMTVAGSCL